MKIIVVGAGLAGLASAAQLARRGAEIIVVDKAGVAEGTSYANAGLMTPSMADPWNSPGVAGHLFTALFAREAGMRLRLKAVPSLLAWGPQFLWHSAPHLHRRATESLFQLAAYSLKETLPLIEQFGPRFDAQRAGTMKVFRDAKVFDAQKAIGAHLAELGLRCDVLTPAEAVAAEPALAESAHELIGALRYPDDASADARKFCLLLAEQIKAAGGVIRTGENVTTLLVRDGRVHGVMTERGPLQADGVVVATGARAAQLTGRVGVRPAVRPAKGYSLTFSLSGANGAPHMPVIDEARHIAITPMGDRLRVAGMAEFTGFDARVSAENVAPFRNALAALFPQLQAMASGPAELWSGFRPMSADGAPFIGATRAEGLWLNVGHGHLGWTLAMGSGGLLADLIMGASPAIDPAPYAPSR